MNDIKAHYTSYYAPLVRKFCSELSQWPASDFENMPKIFLPLFGDRFESSPLRIAFIGIDTGGWFDLPEFLQKASVEPELVIEADLNWFSHDVPFLDWKDRNRTRHQFWGFILFFLAKVYGIDNWTILKRDKFNSIVRSLAWANSNSMEFYNSSCEENGVPIDVWKRVKDASEAFDRLSHIITVLNPNVCIILNKELDVSRYFQGLQWNELETRARVTHYRIEPQGIHVFHVPHPHGMLFSSAGEHFASTLNRMLVDNKLAVEFPEFIELNEGAVRVKEFLIMNAPRPVNTDKFDCIRWLSGELHKCNSVMSVPCLADIMNQLGYLTNDGASYSGGRGSYRLVKYAYERIRISHGQDDANIIAATFVRPDGEYAYDID